MNLFKRILELASMRLSLSPKEIRFSISRKDWVDFALTMFVCFLIIVYKINKASN